ncbi:MAG: PRC-barrel domain-containing protein [Candidatus Aenigmatarchaeota archaeon]
MPVNVEKLSEMFSKDVFTDRGKYCGQVKNVKIDLGRFRIGSMVLKAKKGSYMARMLGGKRGVVIPYQFIKAIGDIVIVKHISPEAIKGQQKQEAKVQETAEGTKTSEAVAREEEQEEEEEEVNMPF